MEDVTHIYKSLRVQANSLTIIILGLIATQPEQVKIALSLILGSGYVDSHWKAIVSVTGLLGMVIHSYGSVRKGSEVPFKDR